MAQVNYTHLSPELQAMIFNQVFDNPIQKPCVNNFCCLISHSVRPRPNSTTTAILSVNHQMHSGIMTYQFFQFDIYLIHGRVTACLGHNTQHLYLQNLPLLPSMNEILTRLTELWIIAGKFSFEELNTITPYLSNLRHVSVEHDMTHETVFFQPPVFIVDYCNNSSVYHYPPTDTQQKLVLESKFALEDRFKLLEVGETSDNDLDLRWFLTRLEKRPVPGVRITVHLRCPMRLCKTCTIGGSSNMFRIFEKKMTVRYNFDTMVVLGSGWVEMK